MNNKTKKSIISALLATTIFLTGCGKKSECVIPTRHVHKYTKEITDTITIEKYLDSEYLRVHGYDWNEEYIEITKEDEELYKVIKNVFVGRDNWNYLYNVMASHHDYLEFYYEYYTYETRTRTNSKGETETYTERVHHSGWHTDPKDSDNTGETRLYHHRYYGYRVIYQNGKYKLEQSKAVDDIREIINDYPYFSEDCVTKVYKDFKFWPHELPFLSTEDFDTFEGPDLTNHNLDDSKVKIRK